MAVGWLVEIRNTIAAEVHLGKLLVGPGHRCAHQSRHQTAVNLRAVFHHKPFGNAILHAEGGSVPRAPAVTQHELSTFMNDFAARFQFSKGYLVPPAKPSDPSLHILCILETVQVHSAVSLEVFATGVAVANARVAEKVSRRSLEVERRFGFILRRPLFERGSFS